MGSLSKEEEEKLADLFECVAVTLYFVVETALTNTLAKTRFGGSKVDTHNLREGARNIASKIAALNKGATWTH